MQVSPAAAYKSANTARRSSFAMSPLMCRTISSIQGLFGEQLERASEEFLNSHLGTLVCGGTQRLFGGISLISEVDQCGKCVVKYRITRDSRARNLIQRSRTIESQF